MKLKHMAVEQEINPIEAEAHRRRLIEEDLRYAGEIPAVGVPGEIVIRLPLPTDHSKFNVNPRTQVYTEKSRETKRDINIQGPLSEEELKAAKSRDEASLRERVRDGLAGIEEKTFGFLRSIHEQNEAIVVKLSGRVPGEKGSGTPAASVYILYGLEAVEAAIILTGTYWAATRFKDVLNIRGKTIQPNITLSEGQSQK